MSQHRADIYTFDLEHQGDVFNLVVNNVISWDMITIKMTREEIVKLVDFLSEQIKLEKVP